MMSWKKPIIVCCLLSFFHGIYIWSRSYRQHDLDSYLLIADEKAIHVFQLDFTNDSIFKVSKKQFKWPTDKLVRNIFFIDHENGRLVEWAEPVERKTKSTDSVQNDESSIPGESQNTNEADELDSRTLFILIQDRCVSLCRGFSSSALQFEYKLDSNHESGVNIIASQIVSNQGILW